MTIQYLKMWKIFHKKNNNYRDSMLSVESWKSHVFMKVDIQVKKYFAEKFVVLFDNKMIFNSKGGLHENLMEALSQVEDGITTYPFIFKQIKAHIIIDDENVFLAIKNLPDQNILYPIKKNGFDFDLYIDDANLVSKKIEEIEYNSFSMLVFDIALSNFYKDWINFTPEIEKRAELQTIYTLVKMEAKNKDLSLLNQIEHEKNLKNQAQYQILYEKILKLMPKIESNLETEWKMSSIEHFNEETEQRIKKLIKN